MVEPRNQARQSRAAQTAATTPARSAEQGAQDRPSGPSAPVITLPKGGGAIRGIGEKFAANPVTGTGSMTVPVVASPGRSGFGPQLSLSYDSGAGNGPFGFGWNLSLPSITRKTDKGLPLYDDAAESDVFILSGAEDLVPLVVETQQGWQRESLPPRVVGGVTYNVQRYRPRIEGLFARIERWTNTGDPTDLFWRSISKDNITTWYGRTAQSRIADPADPQRIFSWLICESYDDKGNLIVYGYTGEDDTNVNLAQANERNRLRCANRYLKRIRYGNHTPSFPVLDPGTPWPTLPADSEWYFELVFDYDDHDPAAPQPRDDEARDATGALKYPWKCRQDPFSSYRAGFEVRTYRLCQRVLMFHHIPDRSAAEPGYDGLVRSTDFTYSYEQHPKDARNPVHSFLLEVTQSGYRRDGGGYLKRSLPPLTFEYSRPVLQDTVREVDTESLENLPYGLDGTVYQWTDLHGEGIPGILTEQGGAWFYKRNLSPINEKRDNGTAHVEAKFAPLDRVAARPNLALAGGAQFMDLAGDGQPDLVVLDGPTPGLYEHGGVEGWQPFRPFSSYLNRDTRDPNLKFVDLDGNGHPDVLITEDEAFVWYPSLAEAGFGPAKRVAQALDEERGPRLVFADGTQSIYLADMIGDSLSDLVRIRNGEVCYWPNLGYGRFGAKVTMDDAPWFDHPEQFEQKRIRLADIDGSGTTDIIYLHSDGVRLYFNQSGNSWSTPQPLSVFPHVDDLAAITAVDLLGNGTACLVWSSPLPGAAQRQMRYVNLMGRQKPHLLIWANNNLGAETEIQYAPSTKFYLRDKYDGRPWITRLPFPVHVVERVITYDHISRNRFITRYAYHHGYFDGDDREFRGFGMVEQWDSEAFGALEADGLLDEAENLDAEFHVPRVLTRTWFHTGAYQDRDHISRQFEGEYYCEPGLRDQRFEKEYRALLLPDTVLPAGLSLEEEREACRALKGMMLRQEVYAEDAGPDASADEVRRAETPYTVIEQNFTIRVLQPRGNNRHGVFFTHPREAISYHYERRLLETQGAGEKQTIGDPRVSHAMTLAVDDYGNVLRSVAIAYRRRNFPTVTEPEQQATHLVLTANQAANRADNEDWYRVGVPVETRTFEVVQPPAPELLGSIVKPFGFEVLRELFVGRSTPLASKGLFPLDQSEPDAAKLWPYEQWDWRHKPANAPADTRLRLIEDVRTLYRPDDLGAAQNDPLALLPLGTVESLALPGASYQLAFTPDLLVQVFQRPLDAIRQPGAPSPENLLPDPAAILPIDITARIAADRGGYVDLDGDGHWWIPSGRIFFSANSGDSAATELAEAWKHFFLPRRYRDPFHTNVLSTETFVAYDDHDLLVTQTSDALGNIVQARNDYRMLQPDLVTDPNRNRSQGAFDVLGMVVCTVVMGKAPQEPVEGDSLAGFVADLTQARIDGFYDAADPHVPAPDLLKDASTRIVYDLDRFRRTRMDHPDDPMQWQPAYAATLARETHVHETPPPGGLKIQITFSYSDGFGREIQRKIQAEPGPVTAGGPPAAPRWVGSGWTIFNNKGNPVRQYEPFFDDTHRFRFGHTIGVSPVLFYDPPGRVIATMHPNHTYEKVVFDPWQQTSYDVNDIVAARVVQGGVAQTGDPRTDPDIAGYVGKYFEEQPAGWQTWYQQRIGLPPGDPERDAAQKAAAHADTPTIAHLDTLGRTFLTIARNRVECPGHAFDSQEDAFETRVELDIEGNQRAVIDALGRVVMRCNYSMAGPAEDEDEEEINRIHQASMEAGERWMLNDVAGNPIRAWDSRGFVRRMSYDQLRRPTGLYVTEAGNETLAERTVYGEAHPQAQALNLRGRAWLQLDGAGTVTSSGKNPQTGHEEGYDFKGNPLRSVRRLARDYKQRADWSTVEPQLAVASPATLNLAAITQLLNPLLESEQLAGSTTYDALDRPREVTSPDGSVYQPFFNEANLLDSVRVNLRGAAVATTFVKNIDYNARGQRELIAYGNGATTTYTYDPLSFRLTSIKTTRPPGRNGLSSQIFADPTVVQDLRYTNDPAGNITRIEDAALTTAFNGRQVDPVCRYTYDAIYRLIEASGREHSGQTAYDFQPAGGDNRDYPFTGQRAQPNNLQALRIYSEQYEYDAVGNFEHLRHIAQGRGWVRQYDYAEDSLIEPGVKSNRLSRTWLGNGLNRSELYTYDEHGNMTSMPHLAQMVWDCEDQLQQVDLGGGGRAYYVYDAAGERVRKVIERQNGTRQKERISLGGFEVYREYGGNGSTVNLERETLHVMDDQQRIALVETPTGGAEVIRYQFGNHLGSASLELAADGALISYEEYHPYGTSAFQAGRSAAELSLKRYRYTGKERDEETGLSYHGARYYAGWLGRWVSVDPIIHAHYTRPWFIQNPKLRTDEYTSAEITDPNDINRRNRFFSRQLEYQVRISHASRSNCYEYVGSSPTNYRDPLGDQRKTSELEPEASFVEASKRYGRWWMIPSEGDKERLLKISVSARLIDLGVTSSKIKKLTLARLKKHIQDALNVHAGGPMEIHGQTTSVRWEINWADPSSTRGILNQILLVVAPDKLLQILESRQAKAREMPGVAIPGNLNIIFLKSSLVQSAIAERNRRIRRGAIAVLRTVVAHEMMHTLGLKHREEAGFVKEQELRTNLMKREFSSSQVRRGRVLRLSTKQIEQIMRNLLR